MGKFSGVLLASDFDDTLVPTSALRAQGLSVQGTSPENCAALTYFTENGGRFTISTGRSAATFAPYAAQLPLNAPAVVSGGGALYDYSTGRYCMMTHLPPLRRRRSERACGAFPRRRTGAVSRRRNRLGAPS